MQYNLAKLTPIQIAALDKLPVRNQDAIEAKFGEKFIPSKAFYLLRDATQNFTQPASDVAYQLDARLYEWSQKAVNSVAVKPSQDEIQTAFELGKKAWNEGKKRAPAQNNDIIKMLEGKQDGQSLPILDAFIRGWDSQNSPTSAKKESLKPPKIVAKPFSWNEYPLSKKFMPRHQQKVVQGFGEERETILADVEAMLAKIPGPYSQEKEKDPTVWAHYFYGQSDWYITEYHPDDNVFFGFVILNGDSQYAELGYISVSELVDSNRIELDFHWRPVLLSEAKFDADPGYFPDPKVKAPVTGQSLREAIEALETAFEFAEDAATKNNLREAIEALETALEFA